MNPDVPRLRMFAGPNGSGKSTFKTMLRPELLGIYINPDEIEKELSSRSFLDLDHYEVIAEEKEILDFFHKSDLLEKVDFLEDTQYLRFNDNKLNFHNVGVMLILPLLQRISFVKSSSNIQSHSPLKP